MSESRTATESMLVIRGRLGDPNAGSFRSETLYRTSLAVTDLPSCHRARGFRWNTIDSESGAHSQRSASCFLNPLSPTLFMSSPISASRSYSRSVICRSMLSPTSPRCGGLLLDVATCGERQTGERDTRPSCGVQPKRAKHTVHDQRERDGGSTMKRRIHRVKQDRATTDHRRQVHVSSR